MCEVEVKDELSLDSIQCRTCLSMDRKLSPLGSHLDIFKRIFPQYQYWQDVHYIETTRICWECRGMLLKIVEFQTRVSKATEILEMGQAYIYGTLSNLTTVTYNYDDSTNTVYATQINPPQTDTKPEIKDFPEESGNMSDDINYIDNTIETDLIEIKEELKCENKKKYYKWAEQQVLLNKQPKFKILQDYKDIFRKVEISHEELTLSLAKEKDSDFYNASKLKCDNCVLTFKDKASLRAHVNRYHIQTIGPYTCDICKSHISKKSKLKQHISNHYFKYVCVFCEFSCYHKRHAYRHRKKHRQVFQCVQCELMFGSRREFFKHYKQWHEKYICDLCGVSFKMRYSMEDHMRKRHLPHKCKPCNKIFTRRNGLWVHNKVHHSSKPPAAYCVECDRQFRDVYQYRWHLSNNSRHTPRGILRNPCPGCDKVFSKKIYMKNHYELVHLKNYKHRCEECDKNYLRNCDLVQHRKRVHEGILPPKNKLCYICGRGFSTKRILNHHIRTHTGERPFACPHCPAAFAQKTPLATHIRARHASQTGQ